VLLLAHFIPVSIAHALVNAVDSLADHYWMLGSFG
jgi:hypothetical protein